MSTLEDAATAAKAKLESSSPDLSVPSGANSLGLGDSDSASAENAPFGYGTVLSSMPHPGDLSAEALEDVEIDLQPKEKLEVFLQEWATANLSRAAEKESSTPNAPPFPFCRAQVGSLLADALREAGYAK